MNRMRCSQPFSFSTASRLRSSSSPKYRRPRMSTTTTTPSGPPLPCAVVSMTAGIIRGGRLSMQKYPASSKACIALLLPAPESPVMMTILRLPETWESVSRGVCSPTSRGPSLLGCISHFGNNSMSARSALGASLLSTAPCRRLLSPLRALQTLASQHFSFSFCGLAQQRMRNRWLRRSGSTLVGWLPDDLAEVLRSRRRRRADKRRRKPERADGLYWQIPGIVGKVGSGEGVAPGEEPSALLG